MDVAVSNTDDGAIETQEPDFDQIVKEVLGDQSGEPSKPDIGEDASDKKYTFGDTTFTEEELNRVIEDYHNDNSWKTKNRLESEGLNKLEKELKEREGKLHNREGLVEKVEWLEKLATDNPEAFKQLERAIEESEGRAEYRKEFDEVNQKLTQLEMEKIQAELKMELGDKYDRDRILENLKSINFDDPKQSLRYDYWAYVGKNFEKLLKQGIAMALKKDGGGRPLPPAGGGTSPEPEESEPDNETKQQRVNRVTEWLIKQNKQSVSS